MYDSLVIHGISLELHFSGSDEGVARIISFFKQGKERPGAHGD